MGYLIWLEITNKLIYLQLSKLVESLKSIDFIIEEIREASKDIFNVLLFINRSSKILWWIYKIWETSIKLTKNSSSSIWHSSRSLFIWMTYDLFTTEVTWCVISRIFHTPLEVWRLWILLYPSYVTNLMIAYSHLLFDLDSLLSYLDHSIMSLGMMVLLARVLVEYWKFV